nr:ABC transporter substrate-binding protein [Roseovarius aestuariivivens]
MTLLASALLFLSVTPSFAIDVRAAVLRVDYQTLLPLSRYDLKPDDLGFAGAALADQDNNTTGSFMGHTYETLQVSAPPEEADAALDRILGEGIRLIVILARAEDLLRLTDRAAEEGALVFNAQAPDMAIRDDACRANLLHTTYSYGMQADAVAQFAVWKKWTDWVLVHGSNPPDVALADAFRRAARKFGARIVEEREFEDTGGSRRTDSGHVMVQRQLPVFMQDLPDHDVIIAADETKYFAEYLPFHLWTPRPTLGSAGLRPIEIHGGHEAFGATQFQNRFEALSERYIQPLDYSTWIALRAVGEAVTRASTADPMGVRDYVISDQFELAAFAGSKVTFRDWNGQLRTPVMLYDGRLTVSISPQDGFLHQTSPLDTMGLDRPESQCTAFN